MSFLTDAQAAQLQVEVTQATEDRAALISQAAIDRRAAQLVVANNTDDGLNNSFTFVDEITSNYLTEKESLNGEYIPEPVTQTELDTLDNINAVAASNRLFRLNYNLPSAVSNNLVTSDFFRASDDTSAVSPVDDFTGENIAGTSILIDTRNQISGTDTLQNQRVLDSELFWLHYQSVIEGIGDKAGDVIRVTSTTTTTPMGGGTPSTTTTISTLKAGTFTELQAGLIYDLNIIGAVGDTVTIAPPPFSVGDQFTAGRVFEVIGVSQPGFKNGNSWEVQVRVALITGTSVPNGDVSTAVTVTDVNRLPTIMTILNNRVTLLNDQKTVLEDNNDPSTIMGTTTNVNADSLNNVNISLSTLADISTLTFDQTSTERQTRETSLSTRVTDIDSSVNPFLVQRYEIVNGRYNLSDGTLRVQQLRAASESRAQATAVQLQNKIDTLQATLDLNSSAN